MGKRRADLVGYVLFVAGVGALSVGLFMLATMPGCGLKESRSLVQQEQRESIATGTTADVVRQTEVTPPPVRVTTRDGTTIEMPAASSSTTSASTTASESSDSAASGKATESSTYPLFVKLIGVAVGCFLLMGVAWAIRRQFKAVDLAFAAGDDLAAKMIHKVRTEAIRASGDEATRLSTLAGDMERDRTNWHREP
jgi:hypothetical protein